MQFINAITGDYIHQIYDNISDYIHQYITNSNNSSINNHRYLTLS